jgi:hypothetical protein
MVLHVVNDQIYYGLKNIAKSSSNLDLWVSISSSYQNLIGQKNPMFENFKIFIFEFLR